MKKLAIGVLVALSCVGCSTHCRDGATRGWFGSSNYSACGMGCVHNAPPSAMDGAEAGTRAGLGRAEKEETPCGCSTACQCWKRHQ